MKQTLIIALVVVPTLAFTADAARAGKSKPLPSLGHHHHHHHHHGRWGYSPAVAPLQYVRYLQVVNDTADDMTVYARTATDRTTWSWALAPGQSAVLAIGDNAVFSDVHVWAKTNKASWNTYKNDLLSLVPVPYRSYSIGTYYHSFR